MSTQKIKAVTLGCAKNTVDTESILGQFKNDTDIVIVDENYESEDIVLINTCCFIFDAKEESIETILTHLERKKSGDIKKVIVMGCLSERYRKELHQEMPEIDAIFGVNQAQEIVNYIKTNKVNSLNNNRFLTTPPHYAYLKISEGCNRNCSFCIIPSIRGKHVSRKMEDIVDEAKMLVDGGVKEIMLIAQELTSYGIDNYKKQMLPKLVETLSDIKGLEWLRLHYLYPSSFPVELLDIMESKENICKYIDIPLQHINDRILKSMKRNDSRKSIEELLYKIRTTVPEAAIRTTMIVGYPTETASEFKELVNFVKEQKFNRLGAFIYSAEEGTAAYEMKDSVSHKTKLKRIDELMDVQMRISEQLNEQQIGRTVKVLIDREEEDFFVARTQFDSPEIDNEVLLDKNSNVKIGEFYNVKLTEATAFDFNAILIK